MTKLTATQTEFLRQLFGPCSGNLKQASKAAIGSEDYSVLMTDEVLEAIKRRADNELVLNVPKAVFIMQKMLDEPESMVFLEKLHKVAADILDRAGLAKQERPNSGAMQVGIVMLPTKAALPEPPIQLEGIIAPVGAP